VAMTQDVDTHLVSLAGDAYGQVYRDEVTLIGPSIGVLDRLRTDDNGGPRPS
jgi:hypothetical protein